MLNDQLILFSVFINLLCVVAAFRFGKEWLYGIIAANLILVNTFGAKLIPLSFFGFVTNIGNVFYAMAFFAIHVLLEHYGKKSAIKAVWIGSFLALFFIVMSKLTLISEGVVDRVEINQAITNLFNNGIRLAIASIVPFIAVQYFNIWLYDLLHQRHGKNYLWLRDSVTNILGEAMDSAIFFSIAFFNAVPNQTLLEIMLVGFLLKIFVGLLGTPILYLTYRIKKEPYSF